jgi:Fe-Mn family superoxide dismutase
MYIVPPLPFELDYLEPFISKEIMDVHYNKHHKGYVDKLNQIILSYDPTLFDVMNETTMGMYIQTFPVEIRQNLKNQLGGHINHSFFWGMLSKDDTSEYKKKLESLFNDQFGSFDQALAEFSDAALNHFGSGWVWFCFNPIAEKIEIRSYSNQDCPLFDHLYPLLGIDIWEHAYYLQYKNDKKTYIENFIKIINWKYVWELYSNYQENTDDNCCESKTDDTDHHHKGCCQ